MKIRTKTLTLFIATAILIISSFSLLHLNQENELIIGTWTYKNELNNKWIFTESNCTWEYNGQLLVKFSYEIINEQAPNGVLFSTLKLSDINSSDVYEYEINALTENSMALDYLGDIGTKLVFFTKE